MENATKALIIAASVLIAIVLVAVGVNLLKATGDVSGDAEKVSNQLENTTGNKANNVVSVLEGI